MAGALGECKTAQAGIPAGPADLENWKFRSPPGLETEIFASLGQAEILNQAAVELTAAGVTLHDWSAEYRAQFRQFAGENWLRWAERSPMARKAVDSHLAFLREIGLLE